MATSRVKNQMLDSCPSYEFVLDRMRIFYNLLSNIWGITEFRIDSFALG